MPAESRPRRFRFAGTIVCGAAVSILVGCGGSQDELRQWMDEQRALAKASVPPLMPPKRFDPEPYTAAAAVDPFSSQKLTVALRQEARQPNSLLASEMRRRREPLEAFPLDGMAMVGSVSRLGSMQALLKVDNLLHQVKVGDYIGQNYGRITRITETEVVLREIVQDAAGEWTEHMASLQLQEKLR